MKDPLAGFRRAILNREVTVLRYPADHEPLPERGAKYPVGQNLVIEIEKVGRKIIKGQPAEWHVTFIRHEKDVPQLLRFTPPTRAPGNQDGALDLTATERARRESAYTSTSHSASPHEPESVGPDWKDTRKAERELERQEARKARLNVERQDQEVERAAARVKQVGKTLGAKGIDLTDELAGIYERLADAERKAA